MWIKKGQEPPKPHGCDVPTRYVPILTGAKGGLRHATTEVVDGITGDLWRCEECQTVWKVRMLDHPGSIVGTYKVWEPINPFERFIYKVKGIL